MLSSEYGMVCDLRSMSESAYLETEKQHVDMIRIWTYVDESSRTIYVQVHLG